MFDEMSSESLPSDEIAAVVFGMAKMNEGNKALGGATVLVGAMAFVANTLVMMFGLKGFLPSPRLMSAFPLKADIGKFRYRLTYNLIAEIGSRCAFARPARRF